MVYSTSKCPHCGKVIKKQTNPVHKIGNPFERCRWCGSIYLDAYTEEWITKSPSKRFAFFLQSGVWARAVMMPVLLLLIPIFLFDMNEDILFALWPLLSIAWLIAGYFIHKNASQDAIAQSLKRTQDVEYLNLLRNSGYTIYPIEEEPQKFNKKSHWMIYILIGVLVLLIAFTGVTLLTDDSENLIKYESYYVGVRTITVENEATAQMIVNAWQNGKANEESMIALMNEYGASQGGGQLYLTEPGELIEEVDAWCFDRSRKVGDVAIIENDYGYTICYFSSVIER